VTVCEFHPDRRQCRNPATVTVTVTGGGLPPEEVPTCDEHVHDWVDDVAATARRIDPDQPAAPDPRFEPEPEPELEPVRAP
jgi:hypothetical protein